MRRIITTMPTVGSWWVRTLFSLLVLIVTLSLPAVGAQDRGANFDPDPLRPPDTSSPRATLRSFLTNMNETIEEWRRNPAAMSAAGYRAWLRAMQTLDYSTTPDGDSEFVRIQRILFLKELLDRIEVPPDNEIPGDREVADGAITQWTIPDTRITIRRVEHGPRVGEFLFSADTVQRLDRLYRQAKHLPYKPGATIGLYETWARSDDTEPARERQLRYRLRPVAALSPRSTLEGFLDSVNRAHALVMDADAALRTTPPTMTKEAAREVELTAINLLERAVSTLDLSQVPEAIRQDVGIETALQLKEIFDRTQLPPVDSIPNAHMVEAERERASGSSSQAAGPIRWRYPNTEIKIVEIMEGERQGRFQFSADTVSRINDFYQEVRDLPYRADDYGTLDEQYTSPGKSEGFYDYYISTPGYLIPHANLLGGWLDELPDWLKTLYGEQTLWQWIGFFLCILVIALVVFVVYRVIKRLAGRLRPPLNDWLMILTPIVVAIMVTGVVDFINDDLNITGDVLAIALTGGSIIVIATTAWAVYLLCKAVAETIIAAPRMQEQLSEASLLRISARVVGFLIGVWIVIAGLRSAGVDFIPLLAGLGVGGLAVALAAQTTIANFIGGLILLVNKPVRVGDLCRYGEDPSSGWLRIGSVEEINWLSTRIRGIDRTITTIPNAEFSKTHIVNLTQRDQRLLMTTLQLRYETTPEQLRYILARLRELLLGHPMVTPDPARVRFLGYGSYSKDVGIFAYLRCQDENTFLAIREDIFLRMEDIISEAGTAFAVPSQTAYLTRDTGLDAERRDEVEAQVEHWRGRGKLPFPEFEEEERERLEDILDYPPKGSPDHQQRVGLSELPPEPQAPPRAKP